MLADLQAVVRSQTEKFYALAGKFMPMVGLFFMLAFINTILDSLKDTLVITAAGGGAQVRCRWHRCLLHMHGHACKQARGGLRFDTTHMHGHACRRCTARCHAAGNTATWVACVLVRPLEGLSSRQAAARCPCHSATPPTPHPPLHHAPAKLSFPHKPWARML